MDIEGKIKVVMDTQTFDSGFQKREFVITTAEQYPQDIKFELIKDKVSLIDQYKVGDELKVHFNIRGNEYKGRYYVNLQAWRIENGSNGAPAPTSGADAFGEFPPIDKEPPERAENEEDDLPF